MDGRHEGLKAAYSDWIAVKLLKKSKRRAPVNELKDRSLQHCSWDCKPQVQRTYMLLRAGLQNGEQLQLHKIHGQRTLKVAVAALAATQ